jgi:hypothetical protein
MGMRRNTAEGVDVTYDLEEGRYHLIIRRADGTLVFRLARRDRKLAEEILFNLVHGLSWEQERPCSRVKQRTST